MSRNFIFDPTCLCIEHVETDWYIPTDITLLERVMSYIELKDNQDGSPDLVNKLSFLKELCVAHIDVILLDKYPHIYEEATEMFEELVKFLTMKYDHWRG